MAMNVTFKKGLASALPQTRDENTFYYVSDTFALYLGDHLISNEVTAAQFEALVNRVSALEGNTFQSQIDTINETLGKMATSDTIVAIDNRLKTVEGKIDNKAEASDLTALTGRVTTAEGEIDTLQSDYNTLNTNYQETKGIVDAFFSESANIDETVDTLKEIQNYINTHGADAAEMSSAITKAQETADKGVADAATAQTKADSAYALGEAAATKTELATTNSNVTAAKAAADAAQKDIDDNKATWNLAGTAVQPAAISDMLTKTDAAKTYQPAGNYEAAGAAKAVQGDTTNTVKECVDAINAMNNLTGQTIGTVENIVNQLTWGSF